METLKKQLVKSCCLFLCVIFSALLTSCNANNNTAVIIPVV